MTGSQVMGSSFSFEGWLYKGRSLAHFQQQLDSNLVPM